MKNLYLNRYAWPGPIIKPEPKKGLKIVIVIPCYHEPGIIDALTSLYQCKMPDCITEVIIVVNHAEDETEHIKSFNIQTAKQIENWTHTNDSDAISSKVIRAFDLLRKTAGVGLARKIGMDEAVRRFEQLNEKKGIIVCFDADCLCSENYLQEIHRQYTGNPETNVSLIYFEHPIHGELPNIVYDGIIDYELHLRYYKNAQKYARFPYCYHTIGSCITVTSEAYQKQGGMNKRKAGEDFYFLQKLFPLGQVHNIQSACVIPSPRPSNRVPFGTGRAITNMLSQPLKEYLTYNPKIFIDLKSLIGNIPSLYNEEDLDLIIRQFPVSIRHFLGDNNFVSEVEKIKKNSSNEDVFLRSFFQWFNGFTVLKYVHFARDHYYENVNIIEAAGWILQELKLTIERPDDKKTILNLLRKLDRSD